VLNDNISSLNIPQLLFKHANGSMYAETDIHKELVFVTGSYGPSLFLLHSLLSKGLYILLLDISCVELHVLNKLKKNLVLKNF